VKGSLVTENNFVQLSQIKLPFKIVGQNISLMDAICLPKHMWQGAVGRVLESVGGWATGLPNKLAGGAANLLGRIQRVGVY
jgi:type IV secretion system protein VirB6